MCSKGQINKHVTREDLYPAVSNAHLVLSGVRHDAIRQWFYFLGSFKYLLISLLVLYMPRELEKCANFDKVTENSMQAKAIE